MPGAPIVALDIGTDTVRVVVGEPREDRHLVITGIGRVPSVGMRKSEIVHFDHVLSCVKNALHQAEENSDVTINVVGLMMAGRHIQSTIHRGTIPILHADHEITRDDLTRVETAARNVNLDESHEFLHTFNQAYSVDDQTGVQNPVGMEASQLSLNELIVYGVGTSFRNAVKVVRTAGVDVEDVAYAGLCSGLAVLSPEQMESGVAVIDLGAGTTDYVVYMSRYLADVGVLGVGGDHVTNDIRIGLRLSQAQAERVKREHGSARVNYALRDRKINVQADGDLGAGKAIRLINLHTIIHVRMEETLQIIRDELEARGLLHHLGAGIVLTGGGAALKGVAELAEKVFNLPCEVGRPRNCAGLSFSVDSPELASAVGMLRYVVRAEETRSTDRGGLKEVWNKLLGR